MGYFRTVKSIRYIFLCTLLIGVLLAACMYCACLHVLIVSQFIEFTFILHPFFGTYWIVERDSHRLMKESMDFCIFNKLFVLKASTTLNNIGCLHLSYVNCPTILCGFFCAIIFIIFNETLIVKDLSEITGFCCLPFPLTWRG